MKRSRIYIVLCSFLLVLFSTSLMVSTLHSHNHIEWNHPNKHSDTGHCLMADSTVCPICAYLFKAKNIGSKAVSQPLIDFEMVDELAIGIPAEVYAPSLPGRSPPSFV